MKTLSTHLEEYLKLRHKLGFKLFLAGGLLHRFVRFAQEKQAAFITSKLALEWATQPADCSPEQWAERLGIVRRFAKFVSGMDPRTEVPPQELLPHRYRRTSPYLYTDEEVSRLLEVSRHLPDTMDLRAISNSTLFGLLAVTGMRVGEAIGLDRRDVDLHQGILTVRHGKFNKVRLLPLHSTTQKKLQEYETVREQLCPQPASPSFLLSERGTRLKYCTVLRWFVCASKKIGLRPSINHRAPRLHDLRHLFAFKILRQWYRQNLDIEPLLPTLTAYLGHEHVADTYWYISAAPELLHLATQRLERRQKEDYHEDRT